VRQRRQNAKKSHVHSNSLRPKWQLSCTYYTFSSAPTLLSRFADTWQKLRSRATAFLFPAN
jgi:hypothetical protein